jgi:GH25 family lysozyme M1 (1,4-beta-N-acetylmuramidase)
MLITLLFVVTVSAAHAPPADAAVPGGPRTLSSCAAFVEMADVSMWQGSIDWRAYATQRPGAWIKATEGTSYKDPRFDSNAWNATLAGVAIGPYHFAQPSIGDAEREADWFVSVARSAIGPRGPPPVLDLEANPHGMSGAQLDAWALQFLRRVEALTGRKPLIYTGAYFAGVGNDPALAEFGLWVAAYLRGYTENPNPCTMGWPSVPNAYGGRGFDAWQFTSSNTAAGIAGHVDMSIVPPEVWAEWTGAGVVPAPPSPDPAPAAPQQIVWGIGSTGAKVAQIQTVVGVSPDGVFGPATAAAVARWQRALGIAADGRWGPATEAATAAFFAFLAGQPVVSLPPPGPEPFHPPANEPTIRFGSRGRAVCDLQHALNDQGYGLDVIAREELCTVGAKTNHVVTDWQRNHGLSVDGVVGPNTWGSLR